MPKWPWVRRSRYEAALNEAARHGAMALDDRERHLRAMQRLRDDDTAIMALVRGLHDLETRFLELDLARPSLIEVPRDAAYAIPVRLRDSERHFGAESLLLPGYGRLTIYGIEVRVNEAGQGCIVIHPDAPS